VNRTRLLIVAVVLVLFVAVGGVLIYSNSHKGQNVTWNVTVTKASSMNPSSLTAHVNDTVTINVTSDTDGEVHLHVYDIHFETRAGQTVSHSFTADKTCGCDIEWESTSTLLGTLTISP
jgi:signal peptidase I